MIMKQLRFLSLLLIIVITLGGCFKSAETYTRKTHSKTEATAKPEEIPSAKQDAPKSKNAPSNPAKQIIEASFKNFSGSYSYSFHCYNTGHRTSNNNEKMKAASVIKLFIMEYIYTAAAEGEIDVDATVSGQSIKSLVKKMITVSDNDATNILIDHFGMGKINDFIKNSGYEKTVLARKMLDTEAAANGKENYTCVSDVMLFLDKLYNNRDTYPQSEMLSVMKQQQISTKFRRDMPSEIEIASKTGELSDTENDVAIVFTQKGDYALVCLTKTSDSASARNTLAICCKEIYKQMYK